MAYRIWRDPKIFRTWQFLVRGSDYELTWRACDHSCEPGAAVAR